MRRDLLAEQRMARQFVEDVVAVGEVARAAHAVGDDDALVFALTGSESAVVTPLADAASVNGPATDVARNTS